MCSDTEGNPTGNRPQHYCLSQLFFWDVKVREFCSARVRLVSIATVSRYVTRLSITGTRYHLRFFLWMKRSYWVLRAACGTFLKTGDQTWPFVAGDYSTHRPTADLPESLSSKSLSPSVSGSASTVNRNGVFAWPCLWECLYYRCSAHAQ